MCVCVCVRSKANKILNRDIYSPTPVRLSSLAKK